ncbi:MAG: pyruvate kinase [Anaerolineales bacterium]|nr:pyruvate kinase [Chloroflexota bacterium]MBL6979746.1 pyruvate kinase [Anaerolineales bacterium]
MNRRAKIVATIGPASQDEHAIQRLISAGMNVARINFSHGKHEDHALSIQRIRKASQHLDQPITILQDLQGPKIRTGDLTEGQVEIIAGQILTLTSKEVPGDARYVSVDYPDLPRSAQIGGRILLDDGNLELQVKSIGKESVETEVIIGGTLKPNKGVNLPGANLTLQTFTDKDKADLAFGLEQNIDLIALSFVRSAKDVSRLRQAIANLSPDQCNIPIIAKLERPEALNNLHEIMHAADGVMVARGDLGVEMPPERVPIEQKRIIQMANSHARMVITATQMLESMMHNPRPTRAEASDVANAIFDGSDAVMLSGETAVGRYPIKSIEMMSSIICQAEAHMREWGHDKIQISEDMPHDDALFITRAANEMVTDKEVAAVAVFTQSGRTARLMSKARPGVPILAFTPIECTYRQMNLMWGVTPHLVPHSETVEDMLAYVEAAIIAETTIQPGQEVVLIAGFPIGAKGPANFALLHTIGQR